jgi:SAM-dependent methyltransferase
MAEASDNRRTVETYEGNAETFIAKSPQVVDAGVKTWLDRAIGLTSSELPVLELGSAAGRDADYLESHGLKVDRTDVVEAFIDRQIKGGHHCRQLDALTDDFGHGYGMVLANAVLLHFTPEEARQVVQKAHDALEPGGLVVLSFKKGDGSYWEDQKLGSPRFFQLWQAADLRTMIEECGFSVEYLEEFVGTVRPVNWLHLIGKRAI